VVCKEFSKKTRPWREDLFIHVAKEILPFEASDEETGLIIEVEKRFEVIYSLCFKFRFYQGLGQSSKDQIMER
jgi:hypothetical protein